eukprot:590644-Amphidinium_carterae.3
MTLNCSRAIVAYAEWAEFRLLSGRGSRLPWRNCYLARCLVALCRRSWQGVACTLSCSGERNTGPGSPGADLLCRF